MKENRLSGQHRARRHLNETDLAAALVAGKLAAPGIDVFVKEPAGTDHRC